ncbi:hypothetical protein KHP62_05880 [Rhodobacteraceae bacterium NNCM2]|nr:hypothetical protein [Coraliihabitans acroporae]
MRLAIVIAAAAGPSLTKSDSPRHPSAGDIVWDGNQSYTLKDWGNCK